MDGLTVVADLHEDLRPALPVEEDVPANRDALAPFETVFARVAVLHDDEVLCVFGDLAAAGYVVVEEHVVLDGHVCDAVHVHVLLAWSLVVEEVALHRRETDPMVDLEKIIVVRVMENVVPQHDVLRPDFTASVHDHDVARRSRPRVSQLEPLDNDVASSVDVQHRARMFEGRVIGARGLEGRREGEAPLQLGLAYVETVGDPHCTASVRHGLGGVFQGGPGGCSGAGLSVVAGRWRRHPELASLLRSRHAGGRCHRRDHEEGDCERAYDGGHGVPRELPRRCQQSSRRLRPANRESPEAAWAPSSLTLPSPSPFPLAPLYPAHLISAMSS